MTLNKDLKSVEELVKGGTSFFGASGSDGEEYFQHEAQDVLWQGQ